MRAILAIPPVIALAVVMSWSASARYSISLLEKEIDALQALLATHSSDFGSDASSTMQKSSGKLTQEKESTHFKELAAMMVEARRTGSKLAMMRLEQRCRAMTKEELITALDEIDGSDTPSQWSGQLKSLLFQQLCKRDPEAALARFADPSRSDRNEMIQTLTSTMREWSQKDLAMAEAWFEEQTAAGKFDSASYNGTNQLWINFQNGLMGALIATDPAAAAVRLSALPEEERAQRLWSYGGTPIKEENQLAYANLVRTLIPEKTRVRILGSYARNLVTDQARRRVIGKLLNDDLNDLPSDYTPITNFFERIQATPEERTACVEESVSAKINPFTDGHVTREKIDTVRAWATEQAPGVADKLTSQLLWYRTGRGSTFSQVAELATEYSDASGNDNLLFEFLSQEMSDSDKGEARLLVEKIVDPARRQVVMDRLK